MNDKFRMLDYECIDTVTFKLDDTIKIKIDLDRVGIALNYTNSDGTHYLVNTSIKIIPNNRRFLIQKKHINNDTPSYIA